MFDKKGEADITLAEVLRYNEPTRLKNSEIEETSIKMTTLEKQIGKPEDDFQTVAMMQIIEEMKDCKKKNSITSIIEHISGNKISRKRKERNLSSKLKHQYQLPMEIQMKIADERWIHFKQHWNYRLKILYQAVPSEDLEDDTEYIKANCQQTKRHKRAKEGDESVIARSETYMDTKPHENFMTELQDGEKKQMIKDVLNNISKISFTPSGDCRSGEKYFKQVEDVCTKGELDCCYEMPQVVKMEKAIQWFFKLNLQKEDLNKAYAEWMEIAGTLEKDKVWKYF
eukprot:jgi/Psemu1/17746/gm1.17746_g